MLNKDASVPLYAQLHDLLRERVLSGELPANSQLPSERELCRTYGVSRITVRRAMAQLLSDGLICTQVGKGTYVAQARLQEELRPLSSFTEDMRRRGLVPTSHVLGQGVMRADALQAAILRVPEGTEVIALRRLRLANDVPIALQLSWLPHQLCPGLLRHDLAQRSLYDVLAREYHLRLTRAETDIEAALADAEEAKLLQLARPAAVLISRQTTYLESEAVIEFTRSVFRGDRYVLHTHTS